MRRQDNEIKIKLFKNLLCDAIYCSLGKYLNLLNMEEFELLNFLTREEVEILVEFAVLKNKLAGVGELNLKVPYVGVGNKFLEKHNLKGMEILSARQLTSLSAKGFVGGRIGFDIENLLDYAEGFLAELSDISGKMDIPIFISFGRDIEEVGRLVNRYKMSPAELIESFGFLDRKCFLYGLNYIDKDDQKLLKSYNPTLIFMPKNDGEEGRGAINLYNFIYNQLKFCFSSGKCYNIDMLDEAKLAIVNTANLMHQAGLISTEEILSALTIDEGEEEVSLSIDEMERVENIFDKKVVKNTINLEEYYALENKVKEIAIKIKEKI